MEFKSKEKVFLVRHGCFVCSGRINEFLLDIFHMEEHGLVFIGYRCIDEWEGFRDVVDYGLKRVGEVNWSDGSVRDWIVAGEIGKDSRWVLIQRVRYSGPEIQG